MAELSVRCRASPVTGTPLPQRAKHPGQVESYLRSAVEQPVLLEEELVIEPEWFVRWAEVQGTCAVDIQLKRGTAHNELTHHRYEVVLHKSLADPLNLAGLPTLDWGTDVADLDELEQCASRAVRPASG
jgi:hypothetical protein